MHVPTPAPAAVPATAPSAVGHGAGTTGGAGLFGEVGTGASAYAPKPRLTVVPIGLRAARAYVAAGHRHHPHTQVGHKFSIAVEDQDEQLRGVAIAGRPVARMLDNGRRLEVLRVCTDGCPNACSALYSSCRRAGMGMGYRPGDIFTYILKRESGASLRAAGWVPYWETKAEGWDRPSRGRDQHTPIEAKVRWHAA